MYKSSLMRPSCKKVLLLGLAAACLAFAQNPVVRIGLVVDGPSERNTATIEVYKQEITDLLGGEFDLRFPADKLLVADWSVAGVRTAIDRLLGDDAVDQVVSIGLISSVEIVRRGPLPKPCYATMVISDPQWDIPGKTIERRVSADRVEREVVSGVKNLSYVTLGTDLSEDIQAFLRVAPRKRMTVLYEKGLRELDPGVEQRYRDAVLALGLERVDFVPVGDSIESALQAIPADTEAVYVGDLFRPSRAERKKLAAGLIASKLASFSQSGRFEVELGLLASLGRSEKMLRRARRVALNMQQVLNGTPAADLPVGFRRRKALVINMATARAIGVSPSFVVLTEAELLNDQRTDIKRSLTLSQVVREAEKTNLDLAVADRRVEATRQLVKEARAPLLPQAIISGGGNFIDSDRAKFGAGQSPQHLAFGELGVSQIIYSNEAQTVFQSEKKAQKAREEVLSTVRLDVIAEAATSYLNVLRTKTIEQIQKDNLQLTRTNLDLSRTRVEIGQAGRDEVYRWESQMANDQREVIDADAARNVAEIQVNRVLNRPIEEPFVSVETGLDDPELVSSFEQLRPYVETPMAFQQFRRFMTAEAFAQSPEVREMEFTVRATRRSLKGAERAYYIPEVVAGASGTYLGRYGAGSTAPDPPLDSLFTNPYNWQVSITGRYDIFNGGFREARRTREREALREAEFQLQATRQRVEQRVRSALHTAGASFAGIDLARNAADAAQRNLKLISDSYAQGVVEIVRLLDAQNWALSADLAAANAVYDHLIDLMNVQRAVGKFDYFRSSQDRQEFLSRLDDFFKKAGYEVRK